MIDVIELIEKASQWDAEGLAYAVATLVSVNGSSYRGPGARMLISAQGQMVGAISGGCLEGDVAEWAIKVLNGEPPRLLTYDTSDEELVWGLGLGCGGTIRALVEAKPQSGELNPLHFLDDCLSHGEPGVLATVFRVEDNGSILMGSKLTLKADGPVQTNLPQGPGRELLSQQARAMMAQIHGDPRFPDRGEERILRLPNESIEVLMEPVLPPIKLFVVGAGYDARPLVRLAREFGYHITLIDHRPAYAQQSYFPEAHQIVIGEPEEIRKKIQHQQRSAVLLMTHNYARDLAYLKQFLPWQPLYLGLLGPRHRTDRILARMTEQGCDTGPAQTSVLFSPVGLDIGAETPEEIALSILAEIKAVLNGRDGGRLRDRKGAIHDR